MATKSPPTLYLVPSACSEPLLSSEEARTCAPAGLRGYRVALEPAAASHCTQTQTTHAKISRCVGDFTALLLFHLFEFMKSHNTGLTFLLSGYLASV